MLPQHDIPRYGKPRRKSKEKKKKKKKKKGGTESKANTLEGFRGKGIVSHRPENQHPQEPGATNKKRKREKGRGNDHVDGFQGPKVIGRAGQEVYKPKGEGC